MLAGPDFSGEPILFADIGLAGHYARPDLFRLEIDEQPRNPVVFGARDVSAPA